MLIDKIKADRIAFMKSKQKNKAQYLTTLLGGLDTEVKRGRKLDDTLVIQEIKKTIKGCDEILSYYPKATVVLCEKATLSAYLPTMMTKEAIKEEIALLLIGNPETKIGDVMKYFKNLHVGMYEPKVVKEVFDEIHD